MAETGASPDTRADRLRVAFVAPRLAAAGAVGGAETLLFNLATLAAASGCDVEYVTTCAKSHYTWENEFPAGESVHEGIKVRRFPVNANRDVGAFLEVQARISRDEAVSDAEEDVWVRNSVNSDAMMDYLDAAGFDRIVVGPYLFGLTMAVAARFPGKTMLVPCLHDECFARVRRIAALFRSVRGFFFNTVPEMELAVRLYGDGIVSRGHAGVVGFSLPDFPSSAARGHELAGTASPYIIFCGRREPLKGTPLLVDYWGTFRKIHPDSDLKFVFTGTGEIERPEGLEGEIIDKGFVSEQDKHDLMAGAVAFCHASLNESLGIVLLESWLARRPVLVHAAGVVLTDQARRSNGGLWFGNFSEFNECLELLLSQPEIGDALAAAGRAFTLSSYGAGAVTSRMLALLA